MAVHACWAGRNTPLDSSSCRAARVDVRSVNTYPGLADEMIEEIRIRRRMPNWKMSRSRSWIGFIPRSGGRDRPYDELKPRPRNDGRVLCRACRTAGATINSSSILMRSFRRRQRPDGSVTYEPR